MLKPEIIERNSNMTLEEVENRIAEIDVEVKGLAESVEENAADTITELTEELADLNARKAEIEAEQRKQENVKAVEEGSKSTKINERKETKMADKVYNYASPEYRSAWLKNIAVNDKGERMFGDMNQEERAAFTFMTSNTTAVVPKDLQDRIIDRVKAEAPMLEDAVVSGLKHGFAIPVRTAIAQGDAAVVGEAAANDDEQDTFTLIEMTGVDIKKHIVMTRRMEFQSIDSFADWLVADLSKRIMVAKERVILARLDGTAPATGVAVNAAVAIDTNNKLEDQAYDEATIRYARSLIDENGKVVIYANNKTIWNGLAGIQDKMGRPMFQSAQDDAYAGILYGARVKEDCNLTDDVAYFGVVGSLKANDFAPLEVFPAIEPKTANRIFTGTELFDAGLENPLAWVKVEFTVES